LAYNRLVQLDQHGLPEMSPWADTVKGRVGGIIKGYINSHNLDDVIAPREHNQQDPRDEIYKKAYLPDFKEGLLAIGTILRWWDPGEFKSQDDVEKQFVSDWSVDIISDIKINDMVKHKNWLTKSWGGRKLRRSY
jgi:hypothetical protein